MSIGRFAGKLAKPLMAELSAVTPKSAGGMALSLLPDALMATMTATAAMPESSSFGERVGAGAFDLIGFGLLPSLGGRLAGRRLGKLFKLNDQGVDVATNIGEMTSQMGLPFLFRNPIVERAYNREYEKQQAQALAQQEQEQRQQIGLVGGLPYGLAGSTLLPPRVADAFDMSGLG